MQQLLKLEPISKSFEEDDQAGKLDKAEEIAAKNRAYVEAARNTTDMISSHIEAVRAAMKAVAHEGAPTAVNPAPTASMWQLILLGAFPPPSTQALFFPAIPPPHSPTPPAISTASSGSRLRRA